MPARWMRRRPRACAVCASRHRLPAARQEHGRAPAADEEEEGGAGARRGDDGDRRAERRIRRGDGAAALRLLAASAATTSASRRSSRPFVRGSSACFTRRLRRALARALPATPSSDLPVSARRRRGDWAARRRRRTPTRRALRAASSGTPRGFGPPARARESARVRGRDAGVRAGDARVARAQRVRGQPRAAGGVATPTPTPMDEIRRLAVVQRLPARGGDQRGRVPAVPAADSGAGGGGARDGESGGASGGGGAGSAREARRSSDGGGGGPRPRGGRDEARSVRNSTPASGWRTSRATRRTRVCGDPRARVSPRPAPRSPRRTPTSRTWSPRSRPSPTRPRWRPSRVLRDAARRVRRLSTSEEGAAHGDVVSWVANVRNIAL